MASETLGNLSRTLVRQLANAGVCPTSLQEFYFLFPQQFPQPPPLCGQQPMPASHLHKQLKQLTPTACLLCFWPSPLPALVLLTPKAEAWEASTVGFSQQQARQTVNNNCRRRSYDDLCVHVSRQSQTLAAALQTGCEGVSSSLNNVLAYSWPTTHKLGCSLCCSRVLGQPPVTMGKVTGPRLSSLVQRARKEEVARPAGLRARQTIGTKSY